MHKLIGKKDTRLIHVLRYWWMSSRHEKSVCITRMMIRHYGIQTLVGLLTSTRAILTGRVTDLVGVHTRFKRLTEKLR